jgi:sugar phosphate permease
VLKLMRYSIFAWAPFYMETVLHYSKRQAGFTSMVFEAAGFLGSLLAGYVADRFFAGRGAPMAALMIAFLGVTAYLYPAASRFGPLMNIVALGLLGFFTYGPDLLVSCVGPLDVGGPAAGARATGFVNALGTIGAILSGSVVARIASHYGWETVFKVMFAPLCLLAALLILPLGRRTPAVREVVVHG